MAGRWVLLVSLDLGHIRRSVWTQCLGRLKSVNNMILSFGWHILPWRQSSHRSLRLGSQGLQTYERNSSCSKSRHPYLQCSSASLICYSYTSQRTFKQPSVSKGKKVTSLCTDRSRCPLFQCSFRSSCMWHTWVILFDSCFVFILILPLVVGFSLCWHSFVVEYFSVAPT